MLLDGRTPPGVRELKQGDVGICYRHRSRTPPGVRELKLNNAEEVETRDATSHPSRGA